jgi:hypothetical protein
MFTPGFQHELPVVLMFTLGFQVNISTTGNSY